jgi:preprotein translocase subunit YajC
VFDLTLLNNTNQCNVHEEKLNTYYYISISYFTLSILVPMILIVILNVLIINKSKKDELKRNKFRNVLTSSNRMTLQNNNSSKVTTIRRNALKSTTNDLKLDREKRARIKISAKKMTKTLVLVSCSFVLLNLPYSIMWYINY